MRVYKRGSVYWYEFEFKGRRVRQSTKSKNQRTAGIIAAAYRTALEKGEVGITERKPVPKFEAAMSAFLNWSLTEHKEHPDTTKRYKTSSKALLRTFGKRYLDTITREDVETYKEERSNHVSKRTRRMLRPATVNRELACLRAMYNHALNGHPQLRNPASRIKLLAEDNQQERVVTFAELQAYLAEGTPVLCDLAELIYEQGMRPGEVFALRGAKVNLDGNYLDVAKGKTKAARRRLDLTERSAAILARRTALYGEEYLFPCETDPTRPAPKAANAHTRALEAWKEKARKAREAGEPHVKFRKFRLYDLRHTWATHAAEAGIDLVTLAAMLGHSRIGLVTRYAHPSQSHQISAMKKLAAHKADRRAREEQSRQSGLHVVSRSA